VVAVYDLWIPFLGWLGVYWEGLVFELDEMYINVLYLDNYSSAYGEEKNSRSSLIFVVRLR
jgi:hypothetical protein